MRVSGGGSSGTASWSGITGDPGDNTALAAELAAKEAAGVAAGLVGDHEALGDPHDQYLTDAESDALYDALGAAAAAVAAHEGASDPHPGYLTPAEAGGAYEALGAAASAVATHEAGFTHVPNGGTTGQALKKASNANGDVAWANDETSEGGGAALDAWPVGSVFIAVVSTSPATLLGGGTWAAFGAGRVLVGLDSGDPDFDTAEETGGAKTVTLTEAQIPAHTHVQNAHTHVQDAHTHNFLPRSATTGAVSSIVTGTLDTSSTISGSNQPHIQSATAVNQNATATNQNTGGGGAHNNVQPYIVVYMWKRTA